MSSGQLGVVAAGHPLTAQAGARVLREGGNAVDAAVGAMLTSFVAEPLLTGLGAGGYLLVAGPGWEPALLDFFVEAPPRVQDGSAAQLRAIDVSFGDAVQVFHIGPASCGVYGTPAGACAAIARWGTAPLEQLAAPAARLAREGVALNHGQAYVAEILAQLLLSTPECAALWAPAGRVLREGEVLRNPELAVALERLGGDGAAPFYSGDLAAAVSGWLAERGGSVTAAALAAYRAQPREPVRMGYRDRLLLTNPPPSAGGTLLAYALALLDRRPGPPTLAQVLDAMAAAQAERTPEFVEGLAAEGFLERFLAERLEVGGHAGGHASGHPGAPGQEAPGGSGNLGTGGQAGAGGSHLGATTHISVLDREGRACSVTCTNGEGSGVVVPGTGIHVNNIMGEEDLNPLGFHRHPAGRRMPSMMAPSVVMDGEGEVELVLGSAGSNRIRSALLQTIVGVVDHRLGAVEAVAAPRVHFEEGVVYAEPGIDPRALAAEDRQVVAFHALNLFFGGVQAVQRRHGQLLGAGDPRRGGVAVWA
ncbi:MAG TPA: gamma-glutamyltransferase [Solirubrobacteraceae bacterium]|jgi:gamma-glutamyltranspeptidase/glutathione hydrolase|nr:gamma-glutamyltransferase [Solirubrobacteraceae bacterium]